MERKLPQATRNGRRELIKIKGRAKKAISILHKEYGSPRHDNKSNPFDELVFIILSIMTTHHSYKRVYGNLVSTLSGWEDLPNMRVAALASAIKAGGLSEQKAKRLIEIAKQVKRDFGKVTLDPLRKMSDQAAENYLLTLPGIGVKAAKCIMMYSLGREVLPVDTHVWRLAKRLELIDAKLNYNKVHTALEEVVQPHDRYAFHVNAISHGRAICQALKPKCKICCINHICPYPEKAPQAKITN